MASISLHVGFDVRPALVITGARSLISDAFSLHKNSFRMSKQCFTKSQIGLASSESPSKHDINELNLFSVSDGRTTKSIDLKKVERSFV